MDFTAEHWIYFGGVLIPWIGGSIFTWAILRGGTRTPYPERPSDE